MYVYKARRTQSYFARISESTTDPEYYTRFWFLLDSPGVDQLSSQQHFRSFATMSKINRKLSGGICSKRICAKFLAISRKTFVQDSLQALLSSFSEGCVQNYSQAIIRDLCKICVKLSEDISSYREGFVQNPSSFREDLCKTELKLA